MVGDDEQTDDLAVLQRYRALAAPVAPPASLDAAVLAAAGEAVVPAAGPVRRDGASPAPQRGSWFAAAGLALAAGLAGVTVWLHAPTSAPAFDSAGGRRVAAEATATAVADGTEQPKAAPVAPASAVSGDRPAPESAGAAEPAVAEALVVRDSAAPTTPLASADRTPDAADEPTDAGLARPSADIASPRLGESAATPPAAASPPPAVPVAKDAGVALPAAMSRAAAQRGEARAVSADANESAAPVVVARAVASDRRRESTLGAAQQLALLRLRALHARDDPGLDAALLDYASQFPQPPLEHLDPTLATRLADARARATSKPILGRP